MPMMAKEIGIIDSQTQAGTIEKAGRLSVNSNLTKR
jgi:hypothetical protein